MKAKDLENGSFGLFKSATVGVNGNPGNVYVYASGAGDSRKYVMTFDTKDQNYLVEKSLGDIFDKMEQKDVEPHTATPEKLTSVQNTLG